jgi:hypothetical protein
MLFSLGMGCYPFIMQCDDCSNEGFSNPDIAIARALVVALCSLIFALIALARRR